MYIFNLTTILFILTFSVIVKSAAIESLGKCENNDPDYRHGDNYCQYYKYICRNVTVEDFHEFLLKLCVDKCTHAGDNMKSESICKHLQELTLENVQFEELNKDVFTKAFEDDEVFDGVITWLTGLTVTGGLIQRVHPEIMESLPNIQELHLTSDHLRNVTLDSSASLQHLEITNSPKLWIINLEHMPALTTLNLANNSLLSDTEIQINATNLESLDISRNQFGRIDFTPGEFGMFPSLKFLNLSHNLIENITYGVLENLQNLETLDLSYNNIESIDPAVLSSLYNLETLNLSHNKLKYLNFDEVLSHLTKLQMFDITDNDWNCDYLHTMLPYNLAEHHVSFRPLNYKQNFEKSSVRGIRCKNPGHGFQIDMDDMYKLIQRVNMRLERLEKLHKKE